MNITVKNLQIKIPLKPSKIETLASHACKLLKLRFKEGISIVFVGEKRMQKLNKTFLGHDYVTDVITFDLKDMAEIVICPLVASKNSRDYGHTTEQELCLYVVHGLLHLAGFDDHAPQDIQKMRLKETWLLKKLL